MAFIVVGPDGKEYGPHDVDTLVSWVRQGQLPAHTVVRNLETSEKTTANLVDALKPFYSGQFAQPPNAGPASSQKGTFMMPSGNPDALWAYYLGVASLVCYIGLLVLPVAMFKAVKGHKAYSADPSIKGIAHVIVAYTLCGISLAMHILVTFLVIASP